MTGNRLGTNEQEQMSANARVCADERGQTSGGKGHANESGPARVSENEGGQEWQTQMRGNEGWVKVGGGQEQEPAGPADTNGGQ